MVRAKPAMVHVAPIVTHVRPLETVIVAPLIPVVVKAIDRALAERVTDAVIWLASSEMPVCVTYPVADAE